jgi:membrane protein DedA with SNARE-associated domain
MHRFTRDPDFHDRRAKRIFARYGLSLLLVCKFVPGLDAVSPPLAGTSRTSRVRFLIFDASGSGLYASVYGGLGYAFSHDLDRAVAYVSRAGTLLLCLAFVAVCVCYIIPKLVRRHRTNGESQFLRITPIDPIPSADLVDMPGGIIGGQENGD